MATLLRTLSIFAELLELGLTVWLGLTLVALAPRRGTSWFAALLLWGFSLVFLLNLLQLGQPLIPSQPWLPYELLRWVLIPLPLAWFWLLHDLLPARLRPFLRHLRRLALGLTLLLLFVAVLAEPWSGRLSGGVQAQEGWFYPLYLLTVTVTVVPTIPLLLRAARLSRLPAYRDANRALAVATLLALVGALYRVGGFWLRPTLPLLPGDLALLAAVILLGFGLVLRQIGQGETNAPAFLYSLVNAAAVTLLYTVVVGGGALLLDLSWLVLVLIVPLAVSTHWVTDWSRRLFDTLFYRAPVQQLRADLRTLVQQLDQDEPLDVQLRSSLSALAQQVDAPALLLIAWEHNAGPATVVAAYPTVADEWAVERETLLAERGTRLRLALPADLPVGMAWGIPLMGPDGQHGTLVAWSSRARGFSDLDLALLEEMSHQFSMMLNVWKAQSQRLAEIEQLVAEYRIEAESLQAQVKALGAEQGEPALEELVEEARTWVEEALRNLYNVAYLGQHAIAQLEVVEARVLPSDEGIVTHLERGQAVRQLCEELVERLRPPGPTPTAEPYPTEWRLYMVLYLAYIEDLPNREIMSRLYIGQGTFHRARRAALDSLADALVELEQATRQ